MNEDRDNNLASAETDPLVSAEYRATATERTPAVLDVSVLKQASLAPSGLRRFTAVWFRPLAFVATLTLALALVIELTSMPEQEAPADQHPEIPIDRASAEFARMLQDDTRRMQEQSSPIAGTADVTTRSCTVEQIADAQEWWQCIQELTDAGRVEEARAELLRFNKAYPDFEAPDLP